MHSKPNPPAQRTWRSRVERSINSLLGLIEGVVADRVLNRMEFNFLEQWLSDHAEVCKSHPYNELMPCVTAAVHAGKLSAEEKTNLTWLCEQLRHENDLHDAGASTAEFSGGHQLSVKSRG